MKRSVARDCSEQPDRVYHRLPRTSQCSKRGHAHQKIRSIPIKNHYEQECNAAALKLLGVPVLNIVRDGFHIEIENLLNAKIQYPKMEANDIPKTLQFLFDTYND